MPPKYLHYPDHFVMPIDLWCIPSTICSFNCLQNQPRFALRFFLHNFSKITQIIYPTPDEEQFNHILNDCNANIL